MSRVSLREKGANSIRKSEESLDNKLKVWDLILKALIPILTILIAIWQFFNQQESLEKATFRKEWWLKRYEIYSELNSKIAKVVSELDHVDTLSDTALKEFKISYWKTLIVEDSIVEPTVRKLYTKLTLYANNAKLKEYDPSQKGEDKKEVIDLSTEVLALSKQSLTLDKTYLQ